MLDLYKSILRSLPPRYTQADMCRDFRRTFETEGGQNVMACLWAMASCGDAKAGASADELRAVEGQRSVIFHILDLATAQANADGTAMTIKQQQQIESDDDGRRNPDDRDDGNYRGDDYRSPDY